nr:granzyme B-like [Pelodiscus sinensis]|eukprot:XP_025043900.1 granzyme B-like [Pelodiscus sinensis]
MAFLLPPGTWTGEIIGGHEAEPHSRPYMAYLRVRRTKKLSKCAGFLVKPNIVLTAAHCQGEIITVVLGAHNVSQWEPSQQVIPVQRQIPHPQYNDTPKNNDIMILQLQGKAQRNRYVDFIKLPSAKQRVRPKTKCSVAGWGRTSLEKKQMSDTLWEADVAVMEDAGCPRNQDEPYPYYDATTMMCVGDPDEGSSSFKGDSGGPLVCGKKAQGIVSWGPEDGTPPAVYTRVTAFIPWIQKTMKDLQP